MKRKYPKKCPKCKEYMEPIFNEVHDMSLRLGFQHNTNTQPVSWKCMNCDVIFDVDEFGDLQLDN